MVPIERILVVEDNVGDFMLLRYHLKRALDRPFEAHNVPTLARAHARLDLERFDLIITDLGLPDAAELPHETLARLAPRTAILVLSGCQDPRVRERLRDVAVLDKNGLEAESLRAAIARALDATEPPASEGAQATLPLRRE